jgi:hypothetical protein
LGVARRDPSILFNRALGLGSHAPATQVLERVVDVYRQAGVARAFVHADETASELFVGQGWQAFCETGEEVPGEPQHSYRNILRAGFCKGRLRCNWIPPS